LRYYGTDFSESIRKELDSARDSVSPTIYQHVIYYTTVHSERQGLKNTCIGAASNALGHINGVRYNLTVLNTKLLNFYNEVDVTSTAISSKISDASALLDILNATVSDLSDALSGTGKYQGKVITANTVSDACYYVRDVKNKIYDFYAAYYYAEFLTENNRINEAALDEYVETFNANGGVPRNLKEQAMLAAFCAATDKVLSDPTLTDEEFNDMYNLYMSKFMTQVTDVDSLSDQIIEEYSYIPKGDSFEICYVVWYNYTMNSSGLTFINAFSASMAGMYANPEDASTVDAFRDQHLNSLQFCDCMQRISSAGNIAVPYYIPESKIDDYFAYRDQHWINEDFPCDNEDDQIVLLKDCFCVEMPFFGQFHIERGVGANPVFPNEESNMCTITYTNNYDCNYGFYLYTLDESNTPNKSFIDYTTIYTFDPSIGNALRLNQQERDEAIIAGTMRDVGFTFSNCWSQGVAVTNLCLGLSSAYNSYYDLPTNQSFPAATSMGKFGAAGLVAILGLCGGGPYFLAAGAFITFIGTEVDFMLKDQLDRDYNEYLQKYLSTRQQNYQDATLFCNTNAVGSFYVDNGSNTINVMPQAYFKPANCQVRLAYACLNGGFDPFNYNNCPSAANKMLGYENLVTRETVEFENGLEEYFSDYCREKGINVSLYSLSNEEIIAICNAFNSDWYHYGNNSSVYRSGAMKPDDIPGFNPEKYK